MTIAVAVLAVVVAVLVLLVAGLLRSHAVILRRLHELGAGVESGSAPTAATPEAPADLGLPEPPDVIDGRPAADLVGTGPRGEAQGVRVAGTDHDTVLAFLSSGCKTCHVFWDELRQPDVPAGMRLVVVTKGDEAESAVAIRSVAPPDVTLVMSTEAWEDYGVPGSPYVVHVDGPSGRVRGEGTGPSWAQVKRMLLEGAGDVDERRGAEARGKAAADARREAEVDQILLDAGITPGDASLYTKADGTLADVPEGSVEQPR